MRPPSLALLYLVGNAVRLAARANRASWISRFSQKAKTESVSKLLKSLIMKNAESRVCANMAA